MYVYDRRVIEKRAREFKRHFPDFAIHYAVKANNNPTILRILKKEGLQAEAVSVGEIRVALASGFKKADISYTCSNQTPVELKFAAKNAGKVHLDSLVQLETWGRLRLGREVSLRINEGIGAGHHRHVMTGGPNSKFGIEEKDFKKVRAIAKHYGLRITGLEQHIGSNFLEEDRPLFLRSVKKLIETARQFPDVVHLDFGGGIGVPYRPGDRRVDIQKLGKEITGITRKFQKERGRPITFALEPGRYLVAEAGYLLATVVDLKATKKHRFAGVNSGFNHLIRPAMYGSYHPIENLSRTGPKAPITLAGNICESGDVFAWDRPMVPPKVGDVIAIGNAGAYGMSMASTYNLRALPKEILLSGRNAKDISFSPNRYVR